MSTALTDTWTGWTGVVAYLDTDTTDRRRIQTPADGRLRTRDFPLPLTYRPAQALRHVGEPAGVITRAWFQDNRLHATGFTDHPALSARLLDGESVPCGVDLDDTSTDILGQNPDTALTVIRTWRLMGLCAYAGPGNPAFPDAAITLHPTARRPVPKRPRARVE